MEAVDVTGDEDWSEVEYKWPPRTQLSRIRVLAPEAERVLTIVCGTHIVAAVWPIWASEKHIVTADESMPLGAVTRRVVAPCRCGRRLHVLDLDKVTTAALAAHTTAPRKLKVAVRNVSPDR